jgi:hypothetical protein
MNNYESPLEGLVWGEVAEIKPACRSVDATKVALALGLDKREVGACLIALLGLHSAAIYSLVKLNLSIHTTSLIVI